MRFRLWVKVGEERKHEDLFCSLQVDFVHPDLQRAVEKARTLSLELLGKLLLLLSGYSIEEGKVPQTHSYLLVESLDPEEPWRRVEEF